MNKKKNFPTEAAYAAGLILLAVGTALMEKADFGMSMIVAPAYIIYRKVSQYYPFFTFGMSEYLLQAFLLVLLALLTKRYRRSYLFSFATAVIYGLILDLSMRLTSVISADAMIIRAVLFIAGMLLCAGGVSFLFHTYISPEAYELFVSEIADCFERDIIKVKYAYDLCSLLISVLLSFAFFGFMKFEGVKAGTFFTVMCNGWLIGSFSSFLEKHFKFQDALPLRRLFEQ